MINEIDILYSQSIQNFVFVSYEIIKKINGKGNLSNCLELRILYNFFLMFPQKTISKRTFEYINAKI